MKNVKYCNDNNFDKRIKVINKETLFAFFTFYSTLSLLKLLLLDSQNSAE